jgi:hypothetical protein
MVTMGYGGASDLPSVASLVPVSSLGNPDHHEDQALQLLRCGVTHFSGEDSQFSGRARRIAWEAVNRTTPIGIAHVASHSAVPSGTTRSSQLDNLRARLSTTGSAPP